MILLSLRATQRNVPSLTMSLMLAPADAAVPTSAAIPPPVAVADQLLPMAVREVARCSVWSIVRERKVTACSRFTGSTRLNVVALVPCVMLLKYASRINGQNVLDEGTSEKCPQIADWTRIRPVWVCGNVRRAAQSSHGRWRRFSMANTWILGFTPCDGPSL